MSERPTTDPEARDIAIGALAERAPRRVVEAGRVRRAGREDGAPRTARRCCLGATVLGGKAPSRRLPGGPILTP